MRRLRPLAVVLLALSARAAVVSEPVRVSVGVPAFAAGLAPSFAPALGFAAPGLAAPSLSLAPALAPAAAPTAAPALVPAAAPAPSLPLVAAIAIALSGPDASHGAGKAAKPPTTSSGGRKASAEAESADAAAEFDGASLKGFGTGVDGAFAPGVDAVGAKARALFRRYLPSLDRPLAVTWEYEDSKLGGGGGHEFDPATGHRIALTPGEADARGIVRTAIGERTKADVQTKIEQLFTSVHEYAHAVFDDAVGRSVAVRPTETAYDAMTEGFAVTAERLVLEGMIRDARELGMTERDLADARALIETRRRWLAEEDETAYAEGVPVWDKAHAAGGEAGVAALLDALSAERMMATRRADAAYQLSLGSHETAAAHLGGAAPLAAGFAALADAAAGRELDPARRSAAVAALDAAGPDGRRWLVRRALTREHDFGDAGEELWIVPVFLRHGADLAAALFRLTPLSAELAADAARALADAVAAPGGVARVLEEPGPTARLTTVAAGAESLPWAASAKAAWDAALTAWILSPR